MENNIDIDLKTISFVTKTKYRQSTQKIGIRTGDKTHRDWIINYTSNLIDSIYAIDNYLFQLDNYVSWIGYLKDAISSIENEVEEIYQRPIYSFSNDEIEFNELTSTINSLQEEVNEFKRNYKHFSYNRGLNNGQSSMYVVLEELNTILNLEGNRLISKLKGRFEHSER
ncbi:hypothetical protein ACPV5Q_20255 [Vibrio astriarenae]